MKKFVLIVGGGTGSRMKTPVPKQFMELAGKPIIMHTIQKFLNFDPEIKIVVVLPETLVKKWIVLCEKHAFKAMHSIANGGETRFKSVKNGLDLINDKGVVFIHDAVRPFVSLQTIRNCFVTAAEKGNALPVIPVTESIRTIENGRNKAMPRSAFCLVQTPQTFDVELIKKAYNQEFTESFTDDASVLEKTGVEIQLVDGNRENIKITYPEDLIIAEAIFRSEAEIKSLN